MFDESASNANDGVIPDDIEFVLHEHDKNGDIVEITYKGFGSW